MATPAADITHAPAAPEAAAPPTPSATEQLQQKLFGVLGAAMTASLVTLGDELGFFTKLKELGKSTSADLAVACNVNERFTREWLYQQACAGTVTTNADATHFWLDEAQAAVLASEYGPDASPAFLAGMFQAATEVSSSRERLMEAFRTGRGFDYDAMGPKNICATCRGLGVWVRHHLVAKMDTVPGMTAKLEAGATVGDVGCGAGEVLFTLAKAFPKGKYVGYDISSKQIETANKRKAEPEHAGLDITFLNPLEPGQGLPDAPTYDLIITMDAVHDMSRPDQVVPLVRKALKDDGSYIINDPRGRPTPAQNIAEAPDFSTVFYGFSCHSCLPSGMCGENPMGFGTLGFQEKQARELAEQSGFTRFEVIDTFDSPMNNVFRLMP